MNANILNKILIEWDNSDIEDSGLIKASAVANEMKYYLIYKLDKTGKIKIFDGYSYIYSEFKDKVYIHGEHVQLDKDGFTVNEYEPGEYRVYIEDFDRLKELYEYAFSRCKDLTSVIIPNSVKKIDNYAFSRCKDLTSIIIPDSVTSIGLCAFNGCIRLISMVIPNSVISIDKYVFSDCFRLTSIVVEKGNPKYDSRKNCNAIIETTTRTLICGCKKTIIPASVRKIAPYAFCSCTYLTSVTIPNSVTSIDDGAFYRCPNLKKVYVEDINKFNEIKFGNEYSNPTCYGAKLIELNK